MSKTITGSFRIPATINVAIELKIVPDENSDKIFHLDDPTGRRIGRVEGLSGVYLAIVYDSNGKDCALPGWSSATHSDAANRIAEAAHRNGTLGCKISTFEEPLIVLSQPKEGPE